MQIILCSFEQFLGRQRELGPLGRRLQISLRLFQLPRGRFVGNAREQLAFGHALANCAAAGRKFFSQLDET